MPNELKIFISHKMPSDTDRANQIGSKLALYSGNKVKVSHAGKFRVGDDWMAKIKRELDRANWLIYLHTDPGEDWEFCIFECGYFLGKRPASTKDRRLITFCRKQDQITAALKGFDALVISEQAVFNLMHQIYRNPPWSIYPNLSDDEIMTVAKSIVTSFGGEPTATNYGVAPGMIFEIDLDDTAKRELIHFKLPTSTVITGTDEWHQLFGKRADTGGWFWTDLASALDRAHASVYEFLFAKMFQDAIDKNQPRGVLLRSAESGELYRVTLRRYEKFSDGIKHRFF
jgi:hypothetical protein